MLLIRSVSNCAIDISYYAKTANDSLPYISPSKIRGRSEEDNFFFSKLISRAATESHLPLGIMVQDYEFIIHRK